MKLILLFFTIFLFLGCSSKEVLKSGSYTILFKTNSFKFYDSGFINQNKKSISVKIFGVGTPILDMNIYKKSICLNGNCFKKEVFNNNYLSEFYPKDIMQNIISAQPIFNSQNLTKEKEKNNFSQKISQKENFNIVYRVDDNQIYFKDRVNKILIKIKRIF